MKYTKEMAAESLNLTIEETPTSLKFITDSGVDLTVDEADNKVTVERLALKAMNNSPLEISSGAQWRRLNHLAAWIKIRDCLSGVTDA